MVKKSFIFILFLFISKADFSQKNPAIIDKGLIRTQGVISFGKLTDHNKTNLYLNGNLEYYTSSLISLRGDIYYYLPKSNDDVLQKNHQLFYGASYHFYTKHNMDFYLGIQPGIAFTQTGVDVLQTKLTSAPTYNPLISEVVGFNYYATKWFHLFVDTRYVYGSHLSDAPPFKLNELRISFGLGFNLNLFHKKSDS